MNKTLAAILITAPMLTFLSLSATADQRDRGWRDQGGGWHGDIRYFGRHDLRYWRGGRWRHGWHDGRAGWWWVVGGFGGIWYYYPAPVYPYPDPYVPPVAVQQAPPPADIPPVQATPPQAPQNWYYCEPSKAYYPYVSSCPAGWKVVPASPPALTQ
jgi:hypothetical protein